MNRVFYLIRREGSAHVFFKEFRWGELMGAREEDTSMLAQSRLLKIPKGCQTEERIESTTEVDHGRI